MLFDLVTVNVFDNFIKKWRIVVEPFSIYRAGNTRLAMSYTSIASELFVEMSGSGWGASTIDDGNELIFLFGHDSTITARATALQTFEPGISKSTYKHQYAISYTNLQALAQYELIGIRKYSFKEFSDLRISREDAARVQRLSNFFLAELKKANIIKPLQQVNVKDITRHIGDSVMFCSKIYAARLYNSSENKPIVFDVQSNFTDPVINVVILEEDRKNFADAPDQAYLNKDVCISGVVTMRSNVPYIALHSREQLKVKSPPTLDNLSLFVGDSVTISGRIFSARYFSDSKTAPTLLNMGAPYPDQPLTIVIEQKDRLLFDDKPEEVYLDKDITVSGRVTLYKNKPQIFVRSKAQLTLSASQNFVATSSNAASATPDTLSKIIVSSDAVIPARFRGGDDAWKSFLKSNLQAPEPLPPGQQRTVVASFYVDADGGVSNIKIVQSAGEKFDNEALRVLKNMPEWLPRSRGRMLVGEIVHQPITFKDQSKE